MADASKTEKATPKRRRDERKKGNVFLSQDAVAVVSLIATCFTLFLMAGSILEQSADYMSYCLEMCRQPLGAILGQLPNLIMQGIMLVLSTVFPIMLVAALAAVVATMYQTRMLVAGELIKPKFDKLNPLSGLKRLFSLHSLINALKNVLKITVLMIIIYQSVEDMVMDGSRYLHTDLSAALAHMGDMAVGMVVKISIAFVVLAAADYLYQRWEYEEKLKMTKEEVKEEYKQTEGDPKVKGKIKEIQRQRARARMMQQVPQADVVIRNPTHYAVALRYRPETDNAPVVLAKGQDALALRIVQVAEEHGVAVLENVPLARALYAEAELDREIPPSLYNAVAEVLVFIFKLDSRRNIVK